MFTKLEQLLSLTFFTFSLSESIPLSLSLNEGHDVTASPPAQHHHDVDNSSDDENDDESFEGDVMSPAPSSASDSSYSATDIGIILWCMAFYVWLTLGARVNHDPWAFLVYILFIGLFLSLSFCPYYSHPQCWSDPGSQEEAECDSSSERVHSLQQRWPKLCWQHPGSLQQGGWWR